MNKTILNPNIQKFINNNLNSDIALLSLKGIHFPLVDSKTIIEQIESKKRCKTKLPTWFATKNIYYPNKLNIEQTSSEITAAYKAELIHGHSIIDLTGGFGVDCYYFSKHFKSITHCEINEELSEIVTHNYKQLNSGHINTVKTDGGDYLKAVQDPFDWIYIDPSRRHNSKGKVFFLKDCLPNVPEHLILYFKKSNNILIKTSPLLDISVGLGELIYVKRIHIIAVNNEVKELLWVLEKDYSGEISLVAINLKPENNEEFVFKLNEEALVNVNYSLPKSYLYEPNAAIMKSGAFNSVSDFFKIFKLHKHSHLYTSDELMEFPGRRFKIEKVLPYNKKTLKKEDFTKANITTRNFPESVQEIRKKYHIKEGGNKYIFFTTNKLDSKIILICSKLI